MPGKQAPTAARVKAGKDHTGAAAEVSGTFAVTAGGVLTSPPPTTLSPTASCTTCTWWRRTACGDDTRAHKPGLTAVDNLQAAPTKVRVTTADGTAPAVLGQPVPTPKKHEVCVDSPEDYRHSKYPTMSDCAADKFTLAVAVDEPEGKVHYMVVEDATDYSSRERGATTDPTLEQIKAGVDYTDVRTSASVTKLAAGSITATLAIAEYDVDVTFTASTEVLGVCRHRGDQRRPRRRGDRRTARCSPPSSRPASSRTSAASPATTETVRWTATDDSLVAKMHLTSPAVVSYVLLRKGSPAPSPTQILSGKDSAGNSPRVATTSTSRRRETTSSASSRITPRRTPRAAPTAPLDGYGTVTDDATACTIATFANLSNG